MNHAAMFRIAASVTFFLGGLALYAAVQRIFAAEISFVVLAVISWYIAYLNLKYREDETSEY